MTTKPSSHSADMSGRTVIVTGAGSGIGRAIALTFAEAGAAVMVNDVSADRVDETVSMIEAAGGLSIAAAADISDEQAVEHIVAQAADAWGRIDVLCNNAGIMDRMNMPEETPTDLWNKVMSVNVNGTFFFSRAVLPHMLARKSGAIVNTASLAGIRGGCAGVAYVASKHAVVGITRNIAWMHAENGIRCNAICPGATNTDITQGLGLEAFDPKGLQRTAPVQNLGGSRVTEPQSMANAVLFLASDAASFINGAIIPVDGGWCAG